MQLIDASQMFEKRRKAIGNKKNDISEKFREIIVKAYGEFKVRKFDYKGKVFESKIFNNIDFGYNKIIIELPQIYEFAKVVKKKGKFVPDVSKRFSEIVPLDEDIDDYFNREVLPYNPRGWIDKSKTKVGYEIPFTKHFYKYEEFEKSFDIVQRIKVLENEIAETLKELFGNGSDCVG